MVLRNKRLIVAAIAVTIAFAGAMSQIYAGDCFVYYEVDRWELELVEVTVDGEAVENEEEYEGIDFRSMPHHHTQLTFTDVESDAVDHYIFRRISSVP